MDSASWIAGDRPGRRGSWRDDQLMVSVQQITDAHAQHEKAERFAQERRSFDRRPAAYADLRD
jgi:hypothetical protein